MYRLMLWAAAVIAWLPQAASAEGAQPCMMRKLVSLDMQTFSDGEFAVPVAINDQLMNLTVDTGSIASSVSLDAAMQLNSRLTYTGSGGHFLNNIEVDYTTTVHSFALGSLRSSGDFTLLAIPNLLTTVISPGLLGYDVLRNYDVEFDFYRGKFNLFVHNTCLGHAVYWTREAFAAIPLKTDGSHHIVVRAYLDGKPVKVIFDTGSSSSVMSEDAAKSLFGWSDNDPRLKSAGSEKINGGEWVPVHTFPFGSLVFDGIAVTNPQITLIPQHNFRLDRYGDASIVLGMSVLRQLHIYVAYDEGILYLTGAEAQ
ncbi:MAG: aspartyl protease family protein [Proteobacteria bacterium]|nr:aspartyl protease family protein [Pseudomonadota bacterium]